MVEVFKTNVERPEEAAKLVKKLSLQLPGCKINFDLTDCDNILRIEGKDIEPPAIVTIMQDDNYECVVLE